uniref:Uncharacterized protein n=1 Tax=Pyxicephalus adspersus TaxID=30357 RepID=A0AAV3AMD2_PYXAD|nr:TPA: hypothetical protein GDO54_014231 [Pyxicephalus adspersus]
MPTTMSKIKNSPVTCTFSNECSKITVTYIDGVRAVLWTAKTYHSKIHCSINYCVGTTAAKPTLPFKEDHNIFSQQEQKVEYP